MQALLSTALLARAASAMRMPPHVNETTICQGDACSGWPMKYERKCVKSIQDPVSESQMFNLYIIIYKITA